jgi:hypothetical protein
MARRGSAGRVKGWEFPADRASNGPLWWQHRNVARLGRVWLGMARSGKAGIFYHNRGKTMNEEAEVTLYPQWRQAAQDAAELFTYGDVLTKEWLIEHFGLHEPVRGTAVDFQKFQFDLLDSMEGFKETLLVEHKMALENVRGRGYRVLQPNEQTGYTMRQFKMAVAREVRKAANLLQNVAADMLTQDEQRQNIEARGKIAAIHSFARKEIGIKKTLRFPLAKGD